MAVIWNSILWFFSFGWVNKVTVQSFELMGMGMVAIFVVIFAIVIVVNLLIFFTKERNVQSSNEQ